MPRVSDGPDWAITLWLPAPAVARRALDADPIPGLESRLLNSTRNTASQFGHTVITNVGTAVTVVMRFSHTETIQ
jgi:hypothetical protein